MTDVPTPPDPGIEVRDNPDEGRYEMILDGAVIGFAEYRDRDGRRIFVHTIVDPAYGGRGFGNRLARAALDDALAREMPVVARCPFIRAWIERHPEYAERLASLAP